MKRVLNTSAKSIKYLNNKVFNTSAKSIKYLTKEY